MTRTCQHGLIVCVEHKRRHELAQPTGRFIPAENVAALMVFLCGPESGDITGAVLPIDDGWSAS